MTYSVTVKIVKDEDDIVRDMTYTSIFVRKVLKSSTTKLGKKKKSDRVCDHPP